MFSLLLLKLIEARWRLLLPEAQIVDTLANSTHFLSWRDYAISRWAATRQGYCCHHLYLNYLPLPTLLQPLALLQCWGRTRCVHGNSGEMSLIHLLYFSSKVRPKFSGDGSGEGGVSHIISVLWVTLEGHSHCFGTNSTLFSFKGVPCPHTHISNSPSTLTRMNPFDLVFR